MASKPSDNPWQSTPLYLRLVTLETKRDRAAEKLRKHLDDWLRVAHTTLRSGGTTPLDYSLHDDQHALRVAERMWAITSSKAQQNLSPLEVAFLLLAAYLHDIGMSPAADRLRHHHDWLCHGDTGGPHLTPEEQKEFREFLDEHHPTLPVPFPRTHPEHDERARRILSAYAREQHNEWSAEWMRQHLPSHDLYHGWLDDLIQLCTSHHWDIEQVRRSPALTPRAVSHAGETHPLDLRYLACLLRVADILENDPERTPPILYTHRNIIPSSQLYWQRDQFLSVEVSDKPNHEGLLDVCIRCQPRCPAAVIEKAARDLCDAISSELEGCDYLAAQPDSAFGRIPGLTVGERPWALPRRAAFFEPLSRPYEYIDGTFRPDTQALLRLVAGESLYGTPLAAVRELLQNAFDAVREKIARRRLALPPEQNPADPAWEERYGNEERVTLRLERRPDPNAPPGTPPRLYLICEDTGTGMTRDIITRRLLHSGRPPGHTHRELERQCRAKGFTMGRTARFGIGALSYFMLADEVTITTRRWQDCNDADRDDVWQFTTTGTGEFGELRRLAAKDAPVGTKVEWRIKTEATAPEEQLEKALGEYLEEKLVQIPCPLVLPPALQVPSFPALWCQPVEADAFHLTADSRVEYPYLLGRNYSIGHFGKAFKVIPSRLSNIRFLDANETQQYKSYRQQIRFAEEEEQQPNVARIRLTLAWLEHVGGDEAMFWSIPGRGQVDEHREGWETIDVSRSARQSWHGIKSRVEVAFFQMRMTRKAHKEWGRSNPGLREWILHESLGHFDIDIDLQLAEGAHLTASRDEVTISKEAADKVKTLCHRTMRRLAAKVRTEHPGTTLEKQMEELEEWFQKQEAGGQP